MGDYYRFQEDQKQVKHCYHHRRTVEVVEEYKYLCGQKTRLEN